jgi:hypothetical protein
MSEWRERDWVAVAAVGFRTAVGAWFVVVHGVLRGGFPSGMELAA